MTTDPDSPITSLPEGAEKVTAVRTMFDTIAPRYDLVNRLMTFGLDVRWRRRAVAALALPRGARVLDAGAGTGDLCRMLERAGHVAIGADLSWGMLRHARTDAALVHTDVTRLPVRDGSLDGVISGFTLRNLASLDAFFSEIARALRPAGRLALLEVAEPRARLLRAGHRLYFGKVVPRIGGLLSDADAYRYLPRSVAYLPPPGRMLEMLDEAGFEAVERHLLSGGISQLVTATRRRG